MKSGLTYLIILILSAGLSVSEADGAEASTAAFAGAAASLTEMPVSGAAEYTADLPVLLLQQMLATDTNTVFPCMKVHMHLLCNLKELKRKWTDTPSSPSDTDADGYIHPLKYYLYTLEQMMI
ncbi:MAG: hypothetical protein LBH90_07655 [Tannerella sp.]|jgi:hypothetical protein|nr:hypothetical protein [Tannerella sp.]